MNGRETAGSTYLTVPECTKVYFNRRFLCDNVNVTYETQGTGLISFDPKRRLSHGREHERVTTAGIGDSERALQYVEPFQDLKE